MALAPFTLNATERGNSEIEKQHVLLGEFNFEHDKMKLSSDAIERKTGEITPICSIFAQTSLEIEQVKQHGLSSDQVLKMQEELLYAKEEIERGKRELHLMKTRLDEMVPIGALQSAKGEIFLLREERGREKREMARMQSEIQQLQSRTKQMVDASEFNGFRAELAAAIEQVAAGEKSPEAIITMLSSIGHTLSDLLGQRSAAVPPLDPADTTIPPSATDGAAAPQPPAAIDPPPAIPPYPTRQKALVAASPRTPPPTPAPPAGTAADGRERAAAEAAPAPPTFAILEARGHGAQLQLVILAPDPRDRLLYTTDGSDPAAGGGRPAPSPLELLLLGPTAVAAVCVGPGGARSAAAREAFVAEAVGAAGLVLEARPGPAGAPAHAAVLAVVPGGPAAADGRIRPGDRIVSVEG
jgi:hypothetical protein